jgi:hypothetical protein
MHKSCSNWTNLQITIFLFSKGEHVIDQKTEKLEFFGKQNGIAPTPKK